MVSIVGLQVMEDNRCGVLTTVDLEFEVALAMGCPAIFTCRAQVHEHVNKITEKL